MLILFKVFSWNVIRFEDIEKIQPEILVSHEVSFRKMSKKKKKKKKKKKNLVFESGKFG